MKKITILLFTLFCCIAQQSTLKAQTCHPDDYQQLLNFYNQCGGANWTTPWDLTQPVSTWHGVTMYTSGPNIGRVQAITTLKIPTTDDGNGNNVTGSIPNFDLPYLSSLTIVGNPGLIGGIPSFRLPNNTSSLPNLGGLSFKGNTGLTGGIPDFNLPNLTWLIVEGNTGLIGEVPNFDLPNLGTLVIEGNTGLTGGIPDFNLPNLTWLIIAGGLTGGIPDFDLPNLTNLSIGYTGLTGGIPDFDLPNLTNLSIGYNTGLIGEIPNFDLPSLKDLRISFNTSLIGNIPNFNLLPNLTSLSISGNTGLYGNVPNFNFLLNLTWLSIRYSTGLSINNSNFNLPNLVYFNLHNNNFSGNIPNLTFANATYGFGVQGNKFTFGNIANVWSALNNSVSGMGYAPQNTILPLSITNGVLTADLAGMPDASQLTYTWYKDGAAVYTSPQGVNTYTPTQSGTYTFSVTHATITKPSIANRNLILNSEAVSWTGTVNIKSVVEDVTTIDITPNPMSSEARITVSEKWLGATFSIFDLQGRLVLQKTIDQATFYLYNDNLPQGMFFCKVEQQGKVVANGKIIVQ